MNDSHKQTLLKAARSSVEASVKGKPLPEVKTDDSLLNEHRGCFVTLKKGADLRGCIGQFISDKPLVELIVQTANASATSDPRFVNNRVSEHELDDLSIEISVLTPLKKTDDPLSLRLGQDGIYIKRGFASGCFLPQVATETGWDKEEFLSYCCSHKAGLPPDAWKEPETEVYLFSAEVFGADFKDI